jgi:FkbM family methyltransferase
MKNFRDTAERLRKNGLLDHFVHLVAVGRYRSLISDLRYHGLSDLSSAALFNGKTIELPKRSAGIGKELLLHGIHEPLATSLYENMLKPGDRIFEAGANIGYYIAVAEGRLGPNVEYLAVEPDPEVFETLTSNVQSIGKRITLREIAVSENDGESTFFQSASSNLGSIRKSRRTDDQAKKVITTTIDQLCATSHFSPTVLRMDIEGAEVFALRGARNVLKECRPRLFIELHPSLMTEDETLEVLAMLEEAGYAEFFVTDRSYDQPSALHFLPRCRPRLLGLKELRSFIRARYVTALGLLSPNSWTAG